MQIVSRNSVFGISLGTFFLVVGAIWVSAEKVQGYIVQIDANTVAIQLVAKSLKLGRLDDEIADLKSERRDLNRELRRDPENDLIIEQLEEIEDEIEALGLIRECVIEPNGRVCE